jgi:hypothetical protein
VARKPTGRPNGRPNKRALPFGEWLRSSASIEAPEHWEKMLACEMQWFNGRRPSLARVAEAAQPYRISSQGVAKLRGEGERYSRLLNYRLGCIIANQLGWEDVVGEPANDVIDGGEGFS